MQKAGLTRSKSGLTINIYLWRMFSGKVVWITGASSGIGEELALQFAALGAKLILSARRVEVLEKVCAACVQKGAEAAVLPLDLSALESLEAKVAEAKAQFGRIDILINNGGISQRSSVLETTDEVEQRILATNYLSGVKLSKMVLPGMIQQGNGNIVVMSSVTGKFGVPFRSTYAATKHALIGYFDSLRAELKKEHAPVNIHIIVPGYIHTEISYHAVKGDGKEQGVLDPGQANGLSAAKCAQKIIRAIQKNKKEYHW